MTVIGMIVMSVETATGTLLAESVLVHPTVVTMTDMMIDVQTIGVGRLHPQGGTMIGGTMTGATAGETIGAIPTTVGMVTVDGIVVVAGRLLISYLLPL